MQPNWFRIGALAAGIGVVLGAFGAHGLKARVTADLLAIFETGVRYHMYHALALLAVGWLAARRQSRWVSASGTLFLAGMVIFPGSLYLMTLTGVRWLGAITPIGGVCFILGWLALAVAAGAATGRSTPSP